MILAALLVRELAEMPFDTLLPIAGRFTVETRSPDLHCFRTLPPPGDGLSPFPLVRAGRSVFAAKIAFSRSSQPFSQRVPFLKDTDRTVMRRGVDYFYGSISAVGSTAELGRTAGVRPTACFASVFRNASISIADANKEIPAKTRPP